MVSESVGAELSANVPFPVVVSILTLTVSPEAYSVGSTPWAPSANQIDRVWDQLFTEGQARIIRLVVEKEVASPDSVDVRLRDNGVERLVLEVTDSYKQEDG